MANLEQIVSRKAENDTKWKEAQQAERENTTAMQDAGITEIISDPEAYARYQQAVWALHRKESGDGQTAQPCPGTSSHPVKPRQQGVSPLWGV